MNHVPQRGCAFLRSNYDVIVVGARCAGAATALLLARQGVRVLLIERERYGADTLSTHALMRGGVLQLARWGVLPQVVAAATPAVRTTSFHYGDDVVSIPITPRDGIDALYAPRRTLLDRLLVDAASASGADVRFGVRLRDLTRGSDGRVCAAIIDDGAGASRRIEAGLVVGADGRHSTVAQLVDARPYLVGSHASVVVYGHWPDLPPNGYHWYYRPGLSAGAIPTNDGLTCVFVAVARARFGDTFRGRLAAGYHTLLGEVAPDVAAALVPQQVTLRGFAGEPGFLRQSWGPGWALVGDAGYYKDPLTAHGITDALRDAELLAVAIVEGRTQALAAYQDSRDELARGLFDVTDTLASFAWDLTTVRALHETLAREMSREVKRLAAA